MKFTLTSVSLASMVASGLAQVEIDLGSAATFALVDVGGVNDVGASANTSPCPDPCPSSQITGNVATTGHTVDGFAPGSIAGEIEIRNDVADQARADALAVYNQLHPLQGTQVETTADGTVVVTKGMGDDGGNGTTNFTGAVFTPGIYNVLSIMEIVTNLTLTGAGQFIFTSGSHFRMAPNSEIILAGGATVDNVFFASGDSVNISTGATFQGKMFTDSGVFMGLNSVAIGGFYGGGIANLTAGTITLA